VIVLVTGASGVGKTALVKAVEARRLPHIGCYYFDSIGVPPADEMVRRHGSGEAWQAAMMLEWTRRLTKNADGVDVAILDGQVRPTFARDAFTEARVSDGRIVLVDCEVEVREARLKGPRQQPDLASARMTAWAAYLKGQADALGLPVIDTTNRTAEQAASQLLATIGVNAK